MGRLSAIAVRWDLVQPGDWFLPHPLKGEDQHFRIPEALAAGAEGYFYERGRWDPVRSPGVPAEELASLPDFLFAAAREKRASLAAKVLVVAGSNGKTTVKELLGAILRQAHPAAHVSPANHNTKALLASQILKLSAHCPVAAFEVGARRRDDFQLPLSFLQPEVAALLNIGSAHLGEFGSRESLLETKLSVLDSPGLKHCVVPAGDARIRARWDPLESTCRHASLSIL